MKSKRASSRKRTDSPQSKTTSPTNSNDRFLIAAIGASAGGLEAFSELARNLPTDTGIAFVLIQHLDPKHHSILTELVAKETSLAVSEVTDGMELNPNHVYVIPPNATMSLSNHTLRLSPRGEARGLHMPIDHFMRSLAEEQGDCAIGVILSGSGTDGTLGLAEIRAQGGVTFAQDEGTAKYDSMPRSAAGQGWVDYVLSPKGIARELARIARHPYVRHDGAEAAELPAKDHSGLSGIFQLLRRETGVDFTLYRQTTILRRIQRRMVLHKIEKIRDYLKYLHTRPGEITALYQDMLINVTSFFRNPEVFDALKTEVFPRIFESRGAEASVRIWTPGCASGEETYSVAIALLEFLGEKASGVTVQIFGTDVSESGINKARAGVYPENIKEDVSAERLRRFFEQTEGGYRISKNIRDMCIFAQHNLLNDAPFSQMDLICCRNVLIYLEPALQKRVISLFHYATKPAGYLILGASEGVVNLTGLFNTEDRTYKIFSKKASGARQLVTFSLNRRGERAESAAGPVGPRPPSKPAIESWSPLEAQREFDRRLLAQFSQAAVFINSDMEILHTRGNVNRYIKLAPGRASLSIFKMAREGLLFELRGAIEQAKKGSASVRRQNVRIKNGNGNGAAQERMRLVNFEVTPFRAGALKELFFMILFRDAPPEASEKARPEIRKKQSREAQNEKTRIAELEEELTATREYSQSLIETQEATNEELQSANEEILSSNEELQSTNEELETAKEELQSANEELSTVNDELRSRNAEITQMNNDLTNVLSGIDIAVIMVGGDLTIRRFTPQAEKLIGLIPADIGRPFMNINPKVQIDDLQAMVLRVIANSTAIEKDVIDAKGRHFQLRILPYRTLDGKIDGAVITIIDTAPKE